MGIKATDNMYQFQRDKDTKICIAQVNMGFGIGLQPATVCLFWDKWWSPYVNRQCEDRIVGIENPVPVTAITLVTEESIDERIEFMLARKKEWADSVTGDISTDVVIPKLTKQDLLYLLANPADARRYEASYNNQQSK